MDARTRIRALVGASLILVTPFAGAQNAGVMPTDNDLKAAYCLGSDRAMVTDLQNTLNGVQGDVRFVSAAESLRSNITNIQDDVRRLETYVLPKAAADDNYLVALGAAINRGKFDTQGVSDDPRMNACISSCQAQLPPYKTDAMGACVQGCAPPYVAKIRACRGLSWLPF